ncbi:MAG: hypothetical protein ACM3RX_07135 [Methanococcaceae archaeon]
MDFKKVCEDIIENQERYKAAAERLLKNITAGRQVIIDKEDIFQETFYRVVKNSHKWKYDIPVGAQFYELMRSVVSNECKTKCKALKRIHLRWDDLKIKYDPCGLMENSVEINRAVSDLFAWAAVQKDDDILLVLKETLRGLQPKEIACVHTKNHEHVKYIRKILQKKLKELLED